MSRLAQQTSPYLLQHAGNPVDWYPWGEAAFAEARESGRPILLSIGYSACHWCHVMAHESFEDPATAALMNRLFVNVKVDREERPDVDRIYQLAHQLLTRRGGGWPLTMFLCHDDQRPFFGGTYFPPAPRGGMPAFRAVLERVAQVYQEHGPALREQSALLVETLARIEQPQEGWNGALDESPLLALRGELERRFDRDWGGFSPAPKFPHPPMIARLLRDWRATATQPEPDLQAMFMATFTLKRMIEGGLFDQLGGGFARYSVDERWEIPHFEKMLYDNGQLLSVLAEAAQATGDGDFARAMTATADCLLRDFRLTGGSFAAAFDADSEGREGVFYMWTPEQVRAVLDEGDAALFEARFGLDGEPNFEHGWVPVVRHSLSELMTDPRFGSEEAELARRLDGACSRLLAQRSHRIWPARDDKRLTGWNALAIRGLADAARALGREDWAQAASDAVDDLRARHWREGRLFTASRGEQPAHIAAKLDDHAFLLDALLQLGTARFRSSDLRFAIDVAEALLERFEDREHGGFWFTAHDDEPLIHRSRVFADDATPAGNAVAAGALLRLGGLLAEPRYLLAAERTLRAAWALLVDQPLGTVQMVTSLDEWLHPPAIVVLRGEPDSIVLWRRELQRAFDPRVAVFAIPAHERDLPQALSSKRPTATTTAWVCRGTHCEAPFTDLTALRAALA